MPLFLSNHLHGVYRSCQRCPPKVCNMCMHVVVDPLDRCAHGIVRNARHRCGRPDCWRLAVGGNPNVSTGVGALCTLHASEGRVDLEGLSFVLIALARARQSRIRCGARSSARVTIFQGRRRVPVTGMACPYIAIKTNLRCCRISTLR